MGVLDKGENPCTGRRRGRGRIRIFFLKGVGCFKLGSQKGREFGVMIRSPRKWQFPNKRVTHDSCAILDHNFEKQHTHFS